MMSYQEWHYEDASPQCSTKYLWAPLLKLMGPVSSSTRVLDVGCGNGEMVGRLATLGCQVVGIDLSESGIQLARKNYPKQRFEMLAADESVLQKLSESPFDIVVSTEVVEHLYDPKSFIRGCFTAVRPGGRFVCSTPYHGYLKNLAVAAAGGFDRHVSPLWDGGHIKFWSKKTLGDLLQSAGFRDLQFAGAGRFPWLWKSMVLSGQRPPAQVR